MVVNYIRRDVSMKLLWIIFVSSKVWLMNQFWVVAG